MCEQSVPGKPAEAKAFPSSFFFIESGNCGLWTFLPHPQAADAQETEKRQPTVSWAGTYYI